MLKCDLCWFDMDEDEPVMILGKTNMSGHIQCMILYISEMEMELT